MTDLATQSQTWLAMTYKRILVYITLRIKLVAGLLVWQIKEWIGGGLRGIVGIVHDAE